MVTCLELSRIEAGVKALAAFIRQHGGEPSAQVGIFAPGWRLNGESAIFGSIKLLSNYIKHLYQDHSGARWVKL